jgi:DNA-binding HxlR family transcriptional regulator
MLGRTYEGQNCSVACALELVGERWSLLIIRDALFAGSTRFRDFQRSLGLATNTLSARLDRFVDSGLMERRRNSEQSEHYEYVLTDKGRDLQPVVAALSAWGDQWVTPPGPPIVFEHSSCGGTVHQQICCTSCGEDLKTTDVVARPRVET